LDSNYADDTTPAKKTLVTSRLGMDGGSSISGGSSMTRQSSASLAEKLLSSISLDTEARRNDVMWLYLQQIRAHDDTIRMRELENELLRQERANLEDKLHSALRKLSRAERRADRLEMRLYMFKIMGTRRGRSSRRRDHTHRKWTLSPNPTSNGSISSSRSPSRSALKGKRRRVNSQVEKGKGKKVYQDSDREDEAAASLMTG